METKLLKPELALPCDSKIASFIESYESTEQNFPYKIAITTENGIQYRLITVYGQDELEAIHEELEYLGLIDRLAGSTAAEKMQVSYEAVFSPCDDE